MPQADQFHWIVVHQKIHRGPFSEAQVHEYLERGLLRRNDLAVKIDAVAPGAALDWKLLKGHPGWKLLFQFPEFDRRARDAAEAAEAAAKAKAARAYDGPNRREHVSDEAVRQQVLAALPTDFFESAVVGAQTALARPADVPEPKRPQPAFGEATRYSLDWSESIAPRVGVVACAVLAVYFTVNWLGEGKTKPWLGAGRPVAASAKKRAPPKSSGHAEPVLAEPSLGVPVARPVVEAPAAPPRPLFSAPAPAEISDGSSPLPPPPPMLARETSQDSPERVAALNPHNMFSFGGGTPARDRD